MEQLGKSPFQSLCMADCVAYADLFKKYTQLKSDNINFSLANEVANEALVLASRWSEMATHATEVKEKYGHVKSNFWNWAHEHHSTLKQMHIHARMIWKEGNDELRENQKYNGGT